MTTVYVLEGLEFTFRLKDILGVYDSRDIVMSEFEELKNNTEYDKLVVSCYTLNETSQEYSSRVIREEYTENYPE